MPAASAAVEDEEVGEGSLKFEGEEKMGKVEPKITLLADLALLLTANTLTNPSTPFADTTKSISTLELDVMYFFLSVVLVRLLTGGEGEGERSCFLMIVFKLAILSPLTSVNK